MKFGEEASNARPPYGLPLYPNAKVKFSTRDRSSMKIAIAGGLDDLAKFYSSALEERGYALDQETVSVRSRSLHASEPGQSSAKLLVRIDQDADDASSFLLTFVRHST
jgi:hypothetical protein